MSKTNSFSTTDNAHSWVGKYTPILVAFWCVALAVLRFALSWAFVVLVLCGWPMPPDISPVLVTIQRFIPIAGLVYLTWAHTWRSLSHRQPRRFIMFFVLVDVLPCVVGVLWAMRSAA